MKHCTPDECEWCDPWGPTVCNGTKARCRKPTTSAGERPWRYSTVYGGPCACPHDKPDQLSIFDEEDS